MFGVCEYCWAKLAPKTNRYGVMRGYPRFCPDNPCAKAYAKSGAWSNRRYPAPPSDVRKPNRGGVNFALLAAGGAVDTGSDEQVAA